MVSWPDLDKLLPVYQLSAPPRLPAVASRYLPLLCPRRLPVSQLSGPLRLPPVAPLPPAALPPPVACVPTLGFTAVASRCLRLPPVAVAFASCWFLSPRFRLRCGCLPLPPVASASCWFFSPCFRLRCICLPLPMFLPPPSSSRLAHGSVAVAARYLPLLFV